MSFLSIFLQITDTLSMSTAEMVAEPEKMNLWTMATYGGPIMIILAIMLALAVYLFIERMVTLKKASKEEKSFMNRIKDYIHEGKIDSAIRLCQETNNPTARMVEKGISRLGRPMSDVLVAIENVGNGLIPTAYLMDGTIEATEHISKPYFTVQFHPERMTTDKTENGIEIFSYFIDLCKKI